MARILMVCGWYYPTTFGGTEKYVHTLTRALQKAGHTLAVAAPVDSDSGQEYVHEGVPVYRYPTTKRPSQGELRGVGLPDHFESFERILLNFRPEVVHLHSFSRGCGTPHAECAARLSIPVIITVHTPSVNCFRGTMMRWGKVRCDGRMTEVRCAACRFDQLGIPAVLALPLASALPRRPISVPFSSALRGALSIRATTRQRNEQAGRYLDAAKRIVVVCEWLREALLVNGVEEKKIVLCRHGEDAPTTMPKKIASAAGELRIGYIGRIDELKGIHVLINAIRRLPPKANITFSVYGAATYPVEKVYLQRLLKLTSRDRRIRFEGPVSTQQLYEVFAKIDVLAVPSLWMEAGPFVVLEAFAARVPVIGSDLGGISELLQNDRGGFLVKPGDTAAWAGRLLSFLKDRDSVKRMSATIPKVRGMEIVAAEMQRVYEELTGHAER